MAGVYGVLQGGTIEFYLNHFPTCRLHRLLNGQRHLARLSSPESNLTITVTNNCQCSETEDSATLNNLSHAVNMYQLFPQALFIFLVVMVGGVKNIGGVIIVGAVTGVVLAAMTLQFGQVLYAQLGLIVVFVVLMKVRGRRSVGVGKV